MPAPVSTARPRAISGTTRGVLRSARVGTLELRLEPAAAAVQDHVEPGLRLGRRTEETAERLGIGPRIGPDADHDAGDDEEHEIAAMAPAHERRRRHADDGQRDRRGHAPRALGELAHRRDPGPRTVGPVGIPIADAAQQVGADGGGRDHPVGLGEAQHVDAVAPLDRKPRQPPCGRADREGRARCGGPERTGDRHIGIADRRPQPPQARGGEDEQHRRGVHAADRRCDQREDRNVSRPAGARSGGAAHREADEPRQRGEGKQQDREPRGVGEHVGAQGVERRGDGRAGPLPSQLSQQPADADERRGEQSGEPEPLRGPGGETDGGREPYERAGRPQIPDVLVRDRAEADPGIPQERSMAQEPARVDEQVRLGVGCDATHLCGEQEHGRDGRCGQVGGRGSRQARVLRTTACAPRAVHRRQSTTRLGVHRQAATVHTRSTTSAADIPLAPHRRQRR